MSHVSGRIERALAQNNNASLRVRFRRGKWEALFNCDDATVSVESSALGSALLALSGRLASQGVKGAD